MAVTLAQAALLTPQTLTQGVLETFVQESNILDRLPLKGIPGRSFSYNREAALPGVEFRAVNASYSESTGTVAQATESLVILGGDADVDTFIQATGSELNDERATQTAMKAKAASLKFDDTFINGDTTADANAFDGLKKRLTGGNVITMGTNGAPIIGTGSTEMDVFLDKLDELIDIVKLGSSGDGILLMSNPVGTKFRQAARRKTLITDGEAVFTDGVKKRVTQYRGIPIVTAGNNLLNTPILPQTETQGTSTDCSSVYAVRFGATEVDQGVTGLYNTNTPAGESVFDVRNLGEQQSKPAFRTRIEGFLGVAVFGGNAAARLTGVRAS